MQRTDGGERYTKRNRCISTSFIVEIKKNNKQDKKEYFIIN